MEDIINNLGYNALVPMWNATFPNWSIDEYIDTLESTDENEILQEIRNVIIDELRRLEESRQEENKKHIINEH